MMIMKNKFNVRNISIVVIFCAFTLLFINSCKREEYTQSTTDDVNITGYLERDPEQFSLMTQIIKRSGTAGYLGAYGKYTLFTPNNAAITAWLKSKNKSAVEDLTVAELVDVVKYHLLADTVATNKFSDGKLQQITLYGQYLQTGVVNENGSSSIIVNKISKITKSNVRVGNGIIHVMDHVLTPAVKTLAQSIEDNPRYTYFTQALKETGFFDSLNVVGAAVKDTTRRFQTVILESDSALKAAGFATYANFKARYNKTGNPKNQADSLWLYMAYHISAGPSYIPDIITSPAIYTLAPKEVITTKFAGQTLLLNEDEFAGVVEPGTPINRTYSDVTAANGVLHEVKKPFTIKVRVQTAVYFDLGDQPELRANPKWRGAAAGSIDLLANGASLVSGLNTNRLVGQTSNAPTYYYSPTIGGTRQYAFGDQLALSMGTTNSFRGQWWEFRTPMLVKGKYKIWICYSQHGSGIIGQVTVDAGRPGEQVMPNLVDIRQYLSAGGVSNSQMASATADALLLTNGFKKYMATTNDYQGTVRGSMTASGSNSDTMVGRLVGTADIQTTDRHWIRITAIGGGTAAGNMNLDMIHFIPVDADQNWPRFHQSGTIFKRP